MNDAEMINQSGYRRAFRYLKSTVQSKGSRFATQTGPKDVDVEAVERASSNALELVFFPSYARKLTKPTVELNVNIHGWLYSPVPAGKQSRRNRYTMLLARSIAGLPALPALHPVDSTTSLASMKSPGRTSRPGTATSTATSGSRDSRHNSMPIDENGNMRDYLTDDSDLSAPQTPSALAFDSNPFPYMSKVVEDSSASLEKSLMRQDSTESSTSKLSRHYSDHELVNCHANLATRISPFLSKPIAGQTLECEILANGQVVASSKFMTGENGHFRGTIKVTPSETDIARIEKLEAKIQDCGLSATTEIHLVHAAGISVISDMDDTIKHTNIVAGMREAFRNAFVRDLRTLEVTGVRAWYSTMQDMGCKFHYVSNAPYQLWPCLAAFIKIAGLPAGSIHLKQYSGFLQGMFEPAAEKKRANVEKILMDFPDRKFILIGDSGEQDLELYTELAQSEFRRQILGIFIRDVSTSVESGAATPTGETGEDFFSAGKADNLVDERPATADLLGLDNQPETDLSKNQFSQGREQSQIPGASYLQEMRSMLSSRDTIVSEFETQEFVKQDSQYSGASQAPAQPTVKKVRPELPRKPTALKFWAKHEQNLQSKNEHPKDTSQLPDMLASQPIAATLKSTLPALASTMRRPSLRRTASASSYYGEGRRLNKAQERTHAWEIRLSKARASLPKGLKLYTWREGSDCEDRAKELIRATMQES